MIPRPLVKRTPVHVWLGTLRVRIGWTYKIGRHQRTMVSEAGTRRAIERARQRAGHDS